MLFRGGAEEMCGGILPSKILTADGKSLTLLAAFSAATITDGEGTRSYAKALFRLRWSILASFTNYGPLPPDRCGLLGHRRTNLELKNIGNAVKFLLISVQHHFGQPSS